MLTHCKLLTTGSCANRHLCCQQVSAVNEQVANKKPTVLERKLSVSRVFPVDDSAKVESPKVCLSRCLTDAI